MFIYAILAYTAFFNRALLNLYNELGFLMSGSRLLKSIDAW
jgi:hypothetical protein